MINTVPKAVALSEPIGIIPVKPSSLYATIVPDTGKMNVTGFVRVSHVAASTSDICFQTANTFNVAHLPRKFMG